MSLGRLLFFLIDGFLIVFRTLLILPIHFCTPWRRTGVAALRRRSTGVAATGVAAAAIQSRPSAAPSWPPSFSAKGQREATRHLFGFVLVLACVWFWFGF